MSLPFVQIGEGNEWPYAVRFDSHRAASIHSRDVIDTHQPGYRKSCDAHKVTRKASSHGELASLN